MNNNIDTAYNPPRGSFDQIIRDCAGEVDLQVISSLIKMLESPEKDQAVKLEPNRVQKTEKRNLFLFISPLIVSPDQCFPTICKSENTL
jgi:hypothetical protein